MRINRGFLDRRTAERDKPFGENPAGEKEVTDSDHVLVANMPDRTLLIDPFKKMNVRTDQPAGWQPENSLTVIPCGAGICASGFLHR